MLKRDIIKENARRFLAEGAEANNVKAAKEWLRQNVDASMLRRYADQVRTEPRVSQATRERLSTQSDVDVFLYAALNDVNAARMCKKKFLQAVCRMYWSREFTSADELLNFNEVVGYIAEHGLEGEFDRDFNGMSVDEVINEYIPLVRREAEEDRDRLSGIDFEGEGQEHEYNIVRLGSYEQARAYSKYAPNWCICTDPTSFSLYSEQEDYGDEPNVLIYVLLRDDYKTVPEEIGPGCPLDDYGLSMLCVRVTRDGRLRGVTPRWNHENGAHDRMMNTEELSRLLGMNFYDVF